MYLHEIIGDFRQMVDILPTKELENVVEMIFNLIWADELVVITYLEINIRFVCYLNAHWYWLIYLDIILYIIYIIIIIMW